MNALPEAQRAYALARRDGLGQDDAIGVVWARFGMAEADDVQRAVDAAMRPTEARDVVICPCCFWQLDGNGECPWCGFAPTEYLLTEAHDDLEGHDAECRARCAAVMTGAPA